MKKCIANVKFCETLTISDVIEGVTNVFQRMFVDSNESIDPRLEIATDANFLALSSWYYEHRMGPVGYVNFLDDVVFFEEIQFSFRHLGHSIR